MPRAIRVPVLLVLAVLAGASALRAQNGAGSAEEVPFGPGERVEYQVTLGMFGEVGKGSMEVLGITPVRGQETYHLRFDLTGGVLFAKVDDRLQSWMDVSSLISHRFQQDQKEVTYERHRVLDFYPDEGRWIRDGGEDTGPLATDRPLDDVSFVYFARTLPLEVGDSYRLDRYFKKDGNPVVINVLRKDTITVPAGTFPTIVVQPIIQTDGLFGEGGEAELYFTDDERRLLVRMKSKVPVVGRLGLHMTSYRPGEPARPISLRDDDEDEEESK